jgi:colanic acid biosynthesis glycosyl transferase WcaI
MSSVLIISPFFFPEKISTGRYNSVLAQALRTRGHEVTVLCSHPLYPQWRPKRAEHELSGIRSIRGGRWMKYPASPTFRRLILEIWFAFHVVWHSVRFRNRVDIVLSVFPPTAFFAIATKLFGKKVRRIGIVHDLQSVHAVASSQGALEKMLKKAIEMVERRAFSSCDKVIVLSNSMAKEIAQNGYASCSKLKVCYPFATIDRQKDAGHSLAKLLPTNRLHVVYAGALGNKQNPTGLLSGMKDAAIRMPDVAFHIFSEGPHFETLYAEAGETLSNLHFHSLVSESELCELYIRSDVHIVPQAFGTEVGSMPSKLPNIVASGRPIVAVCAKDSELKELINKYDLGIVISSWESDVVGLQLEHFLRRVLPAWKARSNSDLRLEALERFDLDKLITEVLGE